MNVTISDGRTPIPIRFNNGEVEYVNINLYDRHLMERIEAFEESVTERLKKIDFSKYADAFKDGKFSVVDSFDKIMEMTDEERAEYVSQIMKIKSASEEIEAEYCEELDKVLDADFSAKAFKYVSPLTEILVEDGSKTYYMMTVLEALAKEIENHISKLQSATNKHTAKYRS